MPLTAQEITALDRWRPHPPYELDLLATKALSVSELAFCLMLARHFAADPMVLCNRLAAAKDAIEEFLLSRQTTPVDMTTR